VKSRTARRGIEGTGGFFENLGLRPGKRHATAAGWAEAGGGAHMCIGLHFAYMQAKCFARHFLQNLEVSLEPGYSPDWQMWPIPKPRDGLRVTLKPV